VVGIYFHRRLRKQLQPNNNSNPTTKATQQREQPKGGRNTTGTGNEQQSDDGYEVPLNDNVRSGDGLHEYADVTEEDACSDLLTNASRQKLKNDGDYELPLHEYGNMTGDDHAYDRVNRPNDATYQEI
jgi:hypothetical protein